MKLKLVVAVIAIAALPLCAQAQRGGKKVTKADADKVVKMITGDKGKTQAYCDMATVGNQIGEAEQKNDNKKVDELSLKMDELTQKLGPDYAALMDGLQEIDPDSKDGQEIGASFEALDKLCAK